MVQSISAAATKIENSRNLIIKCILWQKKQNNNNEQKKKDGLSTDTSAILPLLAQLYVRVHVPLYTVSKIHIPTIMIILWQELFNSNYWDISYRSNLGRFLISFVSLSPIFMNNQDYQTKDIENQPRLKIFNLNLILTCNVYKRKSNKN